MSALSPTPANSTALRDAWPRATQGALALLLLLAVVLIGVHVKLADLSEARPTELERGALLEPLDLNRADWRQIALIPEVGESKAKAIVQDRDERGPFATVDDVQRVSGVGKGTLTRLRGWVYVNPEETVALADSPQSSKKTSSSTARSRKGETLDEPLDLNTASAEQLRKHIPGLGEVLADKIVAARKDKPFRSVEDLLLINGIKQKTLDKIRPYVTVKRKKDV